MLDCCPATSVPILLLLPSLSLFHPLLTLVLTPSPPNPSSSRCCLLTTPLAAQTMSRHSRNLPALPYPILPHPPPISGFRHPLQPVQVSSITEYSPIRLSLPRNSSHPPPFGISTFRCHLGLGSTLEVIVSTYNRSKRVRCRS